MVYAFVRIHVDTSLTVDPQTSVGVNFYLGCRKRIELLSREPQSRVLTIGRTSPSCAHECPPLWVSAYPSFFHLSSCNPCALATSCAVFFGQGIRKLPQFTFSAAAEACLKVFGFTCNSPASGIYTVIRPQYAVY